MGKYCINQIFEHPTLEKGVHVPVLRVLLVPVSLDLESLR